MADVPKIKSRTSCLFDSKLSKKIIENIVQDIVLMLSCYPKGYYYAVVLKNAPKLELENLAYSLEQRVLEIEDDEVFRSLKADRVYEIWKLKNLSQVRIDSNSCTHKTLLESLCKLREIDNGYFYVVIDEEDKFEISKEDQIRYFLVYVNNYLN